MLNVFKKLDSGLKIAGMTFGDVSCLRALGRHPILYFIFLAGLHLIGSDVFAQPDFENGPIGFAAVDILGFQTTTGGADGDVVVISSGDSLNRLMLHRKDARFEKNHPPLIVLIKGTLTFTEDEMLDVKETYNLSILGIGEDAVIQGFGLNIYKSHNIIVRNIEFRDCPDDAISVDDELTHHVWIDHCTFSDSPDVDPDADRHDGLVDIKHGASFVTVSWNHFYNHKKTCILGHSDNYGDVDFGRLKVTYHHNWFDNTYSRHPRVRFGECHVLNNYYDNSRGGMDYGIASTMEADLFVEANYFYKVEHPTHCGYGSSDPGDLIIQNNVFEDCGIPATRGVSFDPLCYYDYIPDSAVHIPELVTRYSGSGKLDVQLPAGINRVDRTMSKFHLSSYPNPFNPVTEIRYRISDISSVRLIILNTLGEEIQTLVDEVKQAGEHSIIWHANHEAAGIYFVRIFSEGHSENLKMILLK